MRQAERETVGDTRWAGRLGMSERSAVDSTALSIQDARLDILYPEGHQATYSLDQKLDILIPTHWEYCNT